MILCIKLWLVLAFSRVIWNIFDWEMWRIRIKPLNGVYIFLLLALRLDWFYLLHLRLYVVVVAQWNVFCTCSQQLIFNCTQDKNINVYLKIVNLNHQTNGWLGFLIFSVYLISHIKFIPLSTYWTRYYSILDECDLIKATVTFHDSAHTGNFNPVQFCLSEASEIIKNT